MMNATPVFFRPSAAETSGLHLSRRALAGLDQLLPPQESTDSDLKKLPVL